MGVTKFQKKILFWLIVLAVISPAGLLLPELFHSEGAWGEWDAQTIREKTGYVPEGMAKDTALWKAPIPDYQMKKESSLTEKSFHYILSGIAGIGSILLIIFGITKLVAKNGKNP